MSHFFFRKIRQKRVYHADVTHGIQINSRKSGQELPCYNEKFDLFVCERSPENSLCRLLPKLLGFSVGTNYSDASVAWCSYIWVSWVYFPFFFSFPFHFFSSPLNQFLFNYPTLVHTICEPVFFIWVVLNRYLFSC